MNTDAIAKRMVWHVCCALAATVCAMPTKQQLVQAQQLVNDLTADDLRALKAKEKTPGDVAAAHLDLADKAETEAGKYLLLQGAFRLYARSGDYDAAAAVLQRMRDEIADLPPEVVVEIVNSEMRRVAATKAPKVLAIFRDAQRMIKYRKQLAAAELDATAHPENVRYQRRVAECHACLGDWPKALPIFAKIGDEAAKWELGTAKDCDAAKAADFWWNYKAADVEPFKAHAASLYKKGLEDGSITGLRKTLAEKRVKEMECAMVASCTAPRGSGTPAASKEEAAERHPAKVGAPTTGSWAISANVRAPLVRTLKLPGNVDMDFCVIPAGTFEMSNVPEQEPRYHKVTITRPFWISRQFVTSQQNRAVGGTPVNDGLAQKLEKMFPEDDIVFRVKGRTVDVFINAMNERFGAGLPRGYVFRLPTEAELEYAVGAGGKYKNDTIYWNHTRKALLSKGLLSEEEKNAKGVPKEYERVLIFERFPVNPWKLIGGWTNAAQLTLDHVDVPKDVEWKGNPKENLVYAKKEVDPLRSGNRWLKRQWNIGRWLTTGRNDDIFRVVIGPDLVAEKKAGNGKK